MENDLKFRFEFPRPPTGPLVEVSNEDMETFLLRKLKEAENNPTSALWQLALFYKQTRQNGKAMTRLQQLYCLLSDLEERAKCLLTMGQTMEQVGNFASAAGYYKRALALEPMHTWTWYFINNNLGYCLNNMERFSDAEPYCRRAIQMDPNRPNGYKNLGIALTGIGLYREAAQCFVAATQVNAADSRGYHLLMELLKDHPELEYDFAIAAECCRKAVDAAARKVEAMKPVVHRGWRKRAYLLRAKIWAMIRNLWTGAPSETSSPWL